MKKNCNNNRNKTNFYIRRNTELTYYLILSRFLCQRLLLKATQLQLKKHRTFVPSQVNT